MYFTKKTFLIIIYIYISQLDPRMVQTTAIDTVNRGETIKQAIQNLLHRVPFYLR